MIFTNPNRYTTQCDWCGRKHEDEVGHMKDSPTEAINCAKDNDWVITEEGQHMCPKCNTTPKVYNNPDTQNRCSCGWVEVSHMYEDRLRAIEKHLDEMSPYLPRPLGGLAYSPAQFTIPEDPPIPPDISDILIDVPEFSQWRRLVGKAFQMPYERCHRDPLVEVLESLAGIQNGAPEPINLARIIGACEQQAGDGWKADPDHHYQWWSLSGDFGVGVLLTGLCSRGSPASEGQVRINWRATGDYAAAWLRSIVDGDDQ